MGGLGPTSLQLLTQHNQLTSIARCGRPSTGAPGETGVSRGLTSLLARASSACTADFLEQCASSPCSGLAPRNQIQPSLTPRQDNFHFLRISFSPLTLETHVERGGVRKSLEVVTIAPHDPSDHWPEYSL